ncbi:MAG: class I SAM-dependent rRNA methyltransferase [Tannerella sp.]|jgi:23S rRNA (cytosine1962-C5)-methyltransferase|nr:class I SAM-dependent rRNA methyltransferase [Tannerella sp.]
MNYSKLYLKPKKEDSLLRFHPWVFSGAVAQISGAVQEGDIVDVYSSDNRFLGTGHYQIGSICVRILSFEQITVNQDFLRERIGSAYNLRNSLHLVKGCTNNTYRLIHGEGDMLPGLIIDVYDKTAVIQAHSVGMHRMRNDISNALSDVMNGQITSVFYKSEGTLPYKACLHEENEYLFGNEKDASHIAIENGLKFHIDWQKGQKTGFFIDQRDNRKLLQQYAAGRKALNMFCYTGGFSVYALQGGASLVHSVDSSVRAVAIANENVALNFSDDTRHQAFAEDAFNFMENIDNKYDLIILDPPAFAKHRDALRNALRGYQKLNAVAISKIQKGGILFTFSCSQIVSRQDFRLAVFSAAAQTGRKVRILHQLSQPADHPVNIYHPESEYLKGFVLQIE